MKQRKNNPVIVIVIGVFIIFLFLATQLFTGNGQKEPAQGMQSLVDQQGALQRLADETGKPVSYIEENGVIRNLELSWRGINYQSTDEMLNEFLKSYGAIFGIYDTHQMRLIDHAQTESGEKVYHFEQIINGIGIYGSELNFYIDRSGMLYEIRGGYIPVISIDTTPSITESDAFRAIEDYLPNDSLTLIEPASLSIYDNRVFGINDSGGSVLVWQLKVTSQNTYSVFFVDAKTGTILFEDPLLEYGKSYEIFDDGNNFFSQIFGSAFLTKKIVDEDEVFDSAAAQDQDAINVESHINVTYDYFFDNFGWDSFDGNGKKISAHINSRLDILTKCPNAYWSHLEDAMYYCDNETDSVDVFAHEFTHGVTHALVNFKGSFKGISETNALNESFSDIFAAFIDEQHPWQICFSDCKGDDLVRDLANPENNSSGAFPSNYSELVKPGDDLCKGFKEKIFGCGHVNSTIHSHAVYLFTTKIGETKSSQIIFRALKEKRIPSNANFVLARKGIVGACRSMIGEYNISEADCAIIEEGYDAVGIMDPSIFIGPRPAEIIATVTTAALPKPVVTVAAPQSQIETQDSQTVLVMDTSGSMSKADAGGMQKMEAAQNAAENLLDVIATEQQSSGGQINHTVGLVEFSGWEQTLFSLTSSVDSVKDAVWQLYPIGGTAMASGLQAGMNEFNQSEVANKIIVLLGDGIPNKSNSFLDGTPEDYQNEVIGLSQHAGDSGICVYVVGFGDPAAGPESEAYINEPFLRRVAEASRCGKYYGAQQADQLANVFVELRHASLGAILLQKSGTIAQNQTINLGAVAVPNNQAQMVFTLNWPGSYLSSRLIDPNGVLVDENYQGATISDSNTITSIVVDAPKGGSWMLEVFGQDVPEGQTTYNTLISTRGMLESEKSSPMWLYGLLGGAVLLIGFIAISKPKQEKRMPSLDRGSAMLVATGGALNGRQYLFAREVLIGRGERCQIVIPDLSVSRLHARIIFADNAWFIQDQGSRSGTFLNNQPVKSARLQPGDKIRIGATIFLFHRS